ncbi:MAG: biopolymer transporter ExbD [Gammaproteobacteria bacterium]|nr:biopolymer transporter ExbD [Gammaproteobacteria bacterium]
MMAMSKRARRMERHHEQRKRPAINLVSLMDIFTILVFFLLVSSSNVQQLPNKKDIRLPTSVTTKAPQETLIIYVTRDRILLQGREVGTITDEINSPDILINGLVKELKFQDSNTRLVSTVAGENAGKAITVMGDEMISYELIRKILASCREVDYTRIAFASLQKTKSGDDS